MFLKKRLLVAIIAAAMSSAAWADLTSDLSFSPKQNVIGGVALVQQRQDGVTNNTV